MPSPSDHFQPTSPLQAVIVLQVICACLVFAVVAFGGFTVSQTLGKPPRPPQVAWVGAGSVVVSLMVIGILPVVGITLPLFSYGGSSIVTMCIACGLLMNVSMRR